MATFLKIFSAATTQGLVIIKLSLVSSGSKHGQKHDHDEINFGIYLFMTQLLLLMFAKFWAAEINGPWIRCENKAGIDRRHIMWWQNDFFCAK